MIMAQTNDRSLPAPRTGKQPQGPADPQEQFRAFQAQLHGKTFRERMAGAVPEEFRTVGYVDRLITSIFLAVRDSWSASQRKYLLLEADRASLFRAAERIAKKALVVGDNVAWLVPYKGEVQDQIGWKGAITLAMRSGILARYTCQPVFSNDKCSIRLGTTNAIEHEPPMRGKRGDFIGVYAVAWFKEATEPDIEWMDKETVDFIRNMSPGKNSPAWTNWYTEMARAKVFKRLMKRAPTERPIDLDDMDEAMGKTIEGVAETDLSVALPALEQSREAPMDMDLGGQEEREREPVGDRDEPQGEPAGRTVPQPQQQRAQAAPAEPEGEQHLQWRPHTGKHAGGDVRAFLAAFKAAVAAGRGDDFAGHGYNDSAFSGALAEDSPVQGEVQGLLDDLDAAAKAGGGEAQGSELDLGSME